MVSLFSHVVLIVLAVLAAGAGRRPTADPATHTETPARLVWLAEPGPGGGGGGGGNRNAERPRAAVRPGRDALTVPVAPRPVPQTAPEPTPLVAPVNIPAQSLASAADSLPGAIALPPLPTVSQGVGQGGGAGTGTGAGVGPGTGSGLGDGRGGGTGGGVYRVGNGVTRPVEIRQGVPRYTADAMRARIQGSVIVECVVQIDGTCAAIRVLRPLQPSFGLNDEAIRTAGQWRFRPGTRLGEPVPVLVTLEVQFTIR